jgi:hypothetical protein
MLSQKVYFRDNPWSPAIFPAFSASDFGQVFGTAPAGSLAMMNARPREYMLHFEAGATEQQFQPIAPFRAFAVRIGRRQRPQHTSVDYYAEPAGPWLASANVDGWISSVLIAGEEQLTNRIPVELFRTLDGLRPTFPAQQVGSVFKVTLAEPAKKAFTLTVCGKEVSEVS